MLLGFDIGGTKCAAIRADTAGAIVAREAFLTGECENWRAVLDRLIALAEKRLDGRPPEAIGISCGGPLDAARGVILSPPNLPGWDRVPIVELLENALGAPARLQNDANACALAEWRFGAGRGCQNMIFCTFGTGLGAGLILDGKLYEGANGMAGEIGHMRLSPRGPVGYGKRGSFEGYCSGGGLSQLCRLRMGQDMTARELCALADAGDAGAIAVFRESARRLGQGLAVLVDVLNPERIVLGSVFARAQRHFVPEMRRVLAKEALPISLGACEILPAALGERLGDTAAIAVAMDAKP